MSTNIDVRAELDAIGTALGRCRAVRGGLAVDMAARALEISGWSTAQHLYHIALATDMSLTNVANLVRGEGMLIVRGGVTAPLAEKVLSHDRFARGEAQSPRMVRPGDQVDEGYLDTEMARNQEVLEALRPSAEGIAGAVDHIPHQVLGLMTAAHWLRFARLHLEHHLAIIDDIERALRREPQD